MTLTRRNVLELGLAAALARALGLPAPARAATGRAPRAVGFALDLPREALRAAGGARGAAGRRWLVTEPLRAPARFDLLGLLWDDARPAHAEVRVRRGGGEWSRWVPFPHATGHGSDGGEEVRGTEPVWAGGADLLQLRVSRQVRGLRVHFVNSTGTTTPAGRLRARLARARAAAARRPSAAQAPGGPPRIFTRAEWGGDQCPPREAPSYGEVRLAFVHHTVSANDYAPEDSAAIVLATCKFHRDTRKWNDIGYNFLVDRYGQIFEGRAGGIDQAVIGAQVQGFNRVSTGVASIGTFSEEGQTPAGLDALARLIAWKLSLHGVPTEGRVTVTSGGGSANRYPYGAQVAFERISGHRDGGRTECPGNALYAQLPELRAAASRLAGALTRLTIAAERAELSFGEQARLSGLLSRPDGSPIAGASLRIQRREGAGFRTFARVTTAADGTWAATVPVAWNRTVRARFDGDPTAPRATSAPVDLIVTPALRADTDRRRVTAGGVVTISGIVRPVKDRVVLEISRRDRDGRYRPVAERRAPARGGRFTAAIPLNRAGLYRIQARTPPDRRNTAAAAPALFIRALRGNGGTAA